MPTIRVPLVGVHNQRTVDGQNAIVLGEDQRFVNCVFNLAKNPITGKSTYYLEKRPGFTAQSLVSSGNISTGLIRSDIIGSVISAFGTPNSTIYDSTVSVGVITGEALHFNETILSSTGYVMIKSSDGTGWYYASDAKTTLTYTGDTHTNTTIDNLGSTAGMYSGQAISGAGIVAGTRILSVDSTVKITTDTATTATAAGVTITKTPVAKILSANFVTTGTNKTAFVDMDGYLFYATEDGNLYNSDLNSVSAYTAAAKIAVAMSPDYPIAVARHKNHIICFGAASTEFFFNAGNPSGSPLNSEQQYFKRIGIQNQRSMVQLEDDIYFVSSSREGDVQVKRLSNLAISKVSTAEMDRIIGTANATGSAIYLSAFSLGGYNCLLVQVCSTAVITTNTFLLNEDNSNLLLEDGSKIILEADTSSTTGLTRELIYNIDLNIWSEWDSPLLTFVKGVGSGSLNQIIASSRISTSGKIYDINPSAETEVFQDDGAAYTMTVQTSKLDFGTDNRKIIKSITLLGADIQASGTVLVECSDDDYATWQTLGTIDKTQKVQQVNRCGSHKGGRAYRLTDSSTTAFRAQALEIDYTMGT